MGIPYISVPLVYQDLVIVGANTPPGTRGGIGNPRAFSAISGRKIWEFNSVPLPEETGHDSWQDGSWENRLGPMPGHSISPSTLPQTYSTCRWLLHCRSHLAETEQVTICLPIPSLR